MKNIIKVKDSIKYLLNEDLQVTDGTTKIWFFDEEYIVSDNGYGTGEEYEHNHKTFDSAFKEFRKRVERGI